MVKTIHWFNTKKNIEAGKNNEKDGKSSTN